MPADKKPIPSVWARPRKEPQQPALSRELIVAEAIKLLDADGIEALSMRKLGTKMGAAATSLYRHVANKDELIELVVDEVYGELRVTAADDPADWRQALAATARDLRDLALSHPWVSAVLGQVGLSYLGPNMLRVSGAMLATLVEAGFPADEADPAMSTVFSYVIGMTVSETAYLSMIARSGQTEQEWAEQLWPAAEQAVKGHPQLVADYAAKQGVDPVQARQEAFDYGLDRVLDGLATRIP
ncbi:TetR/AcrR family transcriptional regulator [Nonomuraea sp. NBC_01738]|uniref:TetR/AcrR family transcriptional regulator n=1 Tax=Nonomuraea sp. NBC_01738 TaxID=2976003 RepID=UPI002E0DD40F|nr:TetR/AcrR family transcriptional regulator [Nonomuraea sp. NBC_01738]